MNEDGERLRYGVLSLSVGCCRGDGVLALRRSRSRPVGRDRAVCLPAAAESLVLRVATQLPALGSAAPQLRAPRAPRRHALALKAKLQRLAGEERRAAASGTQGALRIISPS